eukprot:6487143-Amphidinium_carterae.1
MNIGNVHTAVDISVLGTIFKTCRGLSRRGCTLGASTRSATPHTLWAKTLLSARAFLLPSTMRGRP